MTKEDPMRTELHGKAVVRMSTRRVSRVAALVAIMSVSGTVEPARGQVLLSETTWGGPNFEVTEGIVLASDGSSYLAGRTGSFFVNHPAIFLVKLAPDGSTVRWQRTWEAPNLFVDDTASDVAVGADGSVYVTGRTLGVRGDALLLKFDAAGALVWQRTWGRGANDSENAEAVATALDGSVYVAGGTTNLDTGASSLAVLKFSADGNLVWQRIWNAGASSGGSRWGSLRTAMSTPRGALPAPARPFSPT